MDEAKLTDIEYETMILERERKALMAWTPEANPTELFALKCNAT